MKCCHLQLSRHWSHWWGGSDNLLRLVLFHSWQCSAKEAPGGNSDHPTRSTFHFYRPQRSCGKVMFLHLSVILFTGGGVWYDTPWADTPGKTPPGQTHPPCRHPSCRIPPGRHPLATHSSGRHPLGRHPHEMATAADSMHPTGMHSCDLNNFYRLQTKFLLAHVVLYPGGQIFV